jgi:hypothetical protein
MRRMVLLPLFAITNVVMGCNRPEPDEGGFSHLPRAMVASHTTLETLLTPQPAMTSALIHYAVTKTANSPPFSSNLGVLLAPNARLDLAPPEYHRRIAKITI